MAITTDETGDEVRRVLRNVRWLVGEPRQLESAIGTLEALTRSLERAPGDDDDGGLEPVRTVLATHLLAVEALRDVDASEAAVTKVVRRAIDGAEHLVAHG